MNIVQVEFSRSDMAEFEHTDISIYTVGERSVSRIEEAQTNNTLRVYFEDGDYVDFNGLKYIVARSDIKRHV